MNTMQGENANMVELFEKMVHKYPERTALKDSIKSFTYRQLYGAALKLSEKLLYHNVKPGDRVVCITQKNTESIICFWGILFAGGIAVLLDQEDGVKINESKIQVVCSKYIILDKRFNCFSDNSRSKILLDISDLLKGNTFAEPYSRPSVSVPDIAYILLTSGTTGIPKAVMVSHNNLLHYTYSIYHRLGFPDHQICAHVSTLAADLGFTNILLALISGGTLLVFNKEESTDPVTFFRLINQENVSVLKITPSHLVSLIGQTTESFKKPITNLIVGGEKLSWNVVKLVLDSGICSNLYNHYGPTETTVGATMYKVNPASEYFNNTRSVPIGEALGDNLCFIPKTDSSVGELYITGPGVCPGYFNNDRENAKRFIIRDYNGERRKCFRTGDICKKLDDKNYEFLYRRDRQVKIRGYRVELGEIESMLARHEGIENVFVAASEIKGHTTLNAYVKIAKGVNLSREEVRLWLSQYLPKYKLPDYFHFYSEIPLNSNGKIDAKLLKEDFASYNDYLTADVAQDQLETWTVLAKNTWSSILNVAEISDQDNFFEIGGDSLLAIQVIGRLQRYGFDVHIGDLNNNPVFSDFVLLDPEIVSNDNSQIQNERKKYRLTASQRQFLRQKKFDLDNYCQSILLESESDIRTREMTLALGLVLQNHPQLSSEATFIASDVVKDKRNSQPEITVGSSLLSTSISKSVQIQQVATKLQHSISIHGFCLFKAHIFIDHQGSDYLYIVCHHLVVDVISWNILIDELLEYYDQLLKKVTPVSVPENLLNNFYYTQPSFDLATQRACEKYLSLKLYRLSEKKSSPDSAPKTKVRFVAMPQHLAAVFKKFEDEETPVSVSGFLLCALGRALFKVFNLSNISIDIEFHGRPQHKGLIDLSRSVAWWSVALPLNLRNNDLTPQICSNLLDETAEYASYTNLPRFGQFNRDDNLPDIRFNFLGHFPEIYASSSLRLKPSSFHPGGTRSAKAQNEYALFFTSRFIGTSLLIDIQYQTNIFSETIIDNTLDHIFDSLQKDLKIEERFEYKSQLVEFECNIPSVGLPMFKLDNILVSKKNQKRIVFLTGATGFLGIHIFNDLLRQDNVMIYCVVRGETQIDAENRLQKHFQYYFPHSGRWKPEKFRVYVGDIEIENFGIPEPDFIRAANEVDIILHAAADVNLIKAYSRLNKINVHSTAHLIQFARTGKQKEFHYVSTLAVSGYTSSDINRNFTEEDFEQGQFFISDYEKTKFESEKLVRDFFGTGGLGKIYRVGHIAADSVNGRFQKNLEQNRIFQIIKGILLIKKIPDDFQEDVAFSYVDIVAKGIAGFSTGHLKSELYCLHLENPWSTSIPRLAEMLNQIGFQVATVSQDYFYKSIKNFRGSQDEINAVNMMEVWMKRGLKFPREVNFIHKNSVDTLARSGLYFAKPDLEWFKSMIYEGIKAGYFYSPESSHSQNH